MRKIIKRIEIFVRRLYLLHLEFIMILSLDSRKIDVRKRGNNQFMNYSDISNFFPWWSGKWRILTFCEYIKTTAFHKIRFLSIRSRKIMMFEEKLMVQVSRGSIKIRFKLIKCQLFTSTFNLFSIVKHQVKQSHN